MYKLSYTIFLRVSLGFYSFDSRFKPYKSNTPFESRHARFMELVLIAFWCVVFPVISAFCYTLGVDISYKCVKIIYIDKFLRIIVNRI